MDTQEPLFHLVFSCQQHFSTHCFVQLTQLKIVITSVYLVIVVIFNAINTKASILKANTSAAASLFMYWRNKYRNKYYSSFRGIVVLYSC